MADIQILEPSEDEAVQIHRYQIDKLTGRNAQTWKLQMQDYLQLQSCWEVIRLTDENRDNDQYIEALLLSHAKWSTQNLKARIYIRDNIDVTDVMETKHLRSAGQIWRHLMDRYETRDLTDEVNVLDRIVQWRMGSNNNRKGAEESFRELEHLNAELREVSDGKNGFNERALIYFFLRGLPEQYSSIRRAILSSGNQAFKRDVVVSNVQNNDSLGGSSPNPRVGGSNPNHKVGDSNWNPKVGDSANRTRTIPPANMECWNCGKKGHRQYECQAPRRDKKDEQDSKPQHSSKSKKAKPKGTSRAARNEDETSNGNSDSNDSSLVINESVQRAELDDFGGFLGSTQQ